MKKPFAVEVKVTLYEGGEKDYTREYRSEYGNKKDFDFVTTLILTFCKILNIKISA